MRVTTRYVWWGGWVVVFCGVLALVLTTPRRVMLVQLTEDRVAQGLHHLRIVLLMHGAPEGDRRALETWLTAKCKDPATSYFELYISRAEGLGVLRLTDEGHVDLRDRWGHPLVYENPSADTRYVYRLYSIGPNGVDEGGSGDDIDFSVEIVHWNP